jgi:GT2 family glycosyltransferase
MASTLQTSKQCNDGFQVPNVTIIVLNWNGYKDTIECLESLLKMDYPNFDIVLTDNDSHDCSIVAIQRWAEEAKVQIIDSNFSPNGQENRSLVLLKNPKNYGFAEGNNIAMRYALKTFNQKYILLLNNDVIVSKEFLTKLIDVAEKKSNAGIVGALNYYRSDPNRIWYSGGLINWAIGKKYDFTRNKIDKGQFEKIREVDDVAGSTFLIKKELLKKIGFLRPEYFFYFEETDFCCRAKKAGYTIYTVMDAKVWHKVAASSRVNTDFQIYFLNRNRFIFMRKNASPEHFISFILHFFTKDFFAIMLDILIRQKNPNRLMVFFKALYKGINYKESRKGANK